MYRETGTDPVPFPDPAAAPVAGPAGHSRDGGSEGQQSHEQEPSRAAAHLLEMAARDAEQWREEARSEAAALVDDARKEADRLLRDGREQADAFLGEARSEAERVRAELDETKRRHEAEVAELNRVATEHRDHLRQHLTDLLHRVDEESPTSGD